MSKDTLVLRHSLSDRLIHWTNATLWFLLLATGIALVDHPQMAILGQSYPAFIRSLVGGGANLLTIHIVLGCVWLTALGLYIVINPKGTLFFLRSIFTPAKGDIVWLIRKGAQMTLGKDIVKRLGMPLELAPQGYYNAGQRILAVAIVFAGIAIALSGILMALSSSIGAAQFPTLVAWVNWAIFIHHFSVWLSVAGLFVHIYMAGISKEERPALLSMFTGTVPMEYVNHHHPLWEVPVEAKNAHKQSNK